MCLQVCVSALCVCTGVYMFIFLQTWIFCTHIKKWSISMCAHVLMCVHVCVFAFYVRRKQCIWSLYASTRCVRGRCSNVVRPRVTGPMWNQKSPVSDPMSPIFEQKSHILDQKSSAFHQKSPIIFTIKSLYAKQRGL